MVDYQLLKNPHKHYYDTRRNKIRLIGLHVTAGLQDLGMRGTDESAEGTMRYGATTSRAASWHKCVDTDGVEHGLPDSYTAFHIRNYNSPSLGLEICNLDARWGNKPKAWVDATLLEAAKVCLGWEKEHNIPRRLLTKHQVDAGEWGYTYHMFLDPTRRRDPGEDFPWQQFVDILEALESGDKPDPTKESDIPKKPSLNDSKTAVRLVVDGDFGPATIGRLQSSLNKSRKHLVKVDGVWGRETKRALQWRLGVEVDGDFGPQSTRALQKKVGATVDGDWGKLTTKALQRYLNKGEI